MIDAAADATTDASTETARVGNPARREAILAAAHHVFFEHGFEGASMSQVALRLGGSKGTLYAYFDSKEALFDALVLESCGRNGAAIFDAPGDTSLPDRLAGWGRRHIALVSSDWAVRMLQIVAAEARRRPEIGRTFYNSGPMAALQGLADRISTEMAAGCLTDDDPHVAAETFSALCRGKWHLRRMLGQEPAPDAANIAAQADRAVGQFLRIYGVK